MREIVATLLINNHINIAIINQLLSRSKIHVGRLGGWIC
jgi:hypothetical protein